MGSFHHHPDGWIYITSGEKKYTDRIENFQKHIALLNMQYELDKKYMGRLYDQGKTCKLYDFDTDYCSENLCWADGDAIIEQIDFFMDKQRE